MSNQEQGSSWIPSEEKDSDNQQTGSRGTVNYSYPESSEPSLWLQSAENCTGFSTREAHEAAHYPDGLNVFSTFEFPLPHSAQEAVSTGQIPCTKEILHCLDKGEPGGSKRKCASMEFQQEEIDVNKNTPKEDSNPTGGCRQQKRFRSAEAHNLTERLRRQRLKEKMKTLQDLIPNCNKRDKASTLDDAIRYIKTLQCQEHQMLSVGAGMSMFHSPWMMPLQGMQIPTVPPPPPPPFLGTGYGFGTGITSSLFNFGSGPLALPRPSSPASSSSSSLAALHCVPEVQPFQNPGVTNTMLSSATSSPMMNLSPLGESTSFPTLGLPSTMQWETSSSSQGAPSSR